MVSKHDNSLLVRALRGLPVERTPIWIMRQAGRYMPEYRAIRSELSFLDLCKNPEKAAEVTLLPIEMLDVDAAIVFSDILVPVEAMGCVVEFGDGGPKLPIPVRDVAALNRLKVPDPARDCPWAAETIRILDKPLGDIPCLGFAGAPFTLASYMIEGGTSRNFTHTKTMMFQNADLLHRLLELISETVVVYLQSQIDAGAAGIQLFDTWAGVLAPQDYENFALPYQKRIFDRLGPSVPKILYVNGCGTYLTQMKASGADVISLDWRVSMRAAREVLGPDVPVQGNLEPSLLYGPRELAAERAHTVLREAGPLGHIFNLGHGILPDVSVESAVALVKAVQSFRH